MMEKLNATPSVKDAALEDSIFKEKKKKKALAKGLLNNAGVYVGVFIVFAVIVIVTTDISVTNVHDMAALGLDFFLLLFCSQSMYINCSDSGMRHGRQSQIYLDAEKRYEDVKKRVSVQKYFSRLYEFCQKYVTDELQEARKALLQAKGISYGRYLKYHYLDHSEAEIRRAPLLSSAQAEAIIQANKMTATKLTPEMLLRRGRGHHRRSPLGIRPETKKHINFIVKFLKTFLVALALSVIVLDVVTEPSWVLFASVCLKLLSVVLSGFGGYKFGFENVVVDTVDYMTDQADLLERAMQYIDTTPAGAFGEGAEDFGEKKLEHYSDIVYDPSYYWDISK